MTDNPIFTDETKAREYLEATRWPQGPFCPHCGTFENIKRLEGKSHRAGLHQCNDCRQHFTVTVGTVYERSHIPLHKWLYATHLMCASKKGISSKQLERMLGVTYKTAWFMSHRIRESMKPASGGVLGGGGGIVEADETYWGNKKPYGKNPKGFGHKMKIVSLVERNGNARSFHVSRVNSKTLKPLLAANIARDAKLMTDDATFYKKLGKDYASHEAVMHSRGEYVRGNVTTNTVEGFFSILKRGLIGTFHHVGEQHLQRYVTEFDFRYNHRETRVKIDGKWEKAGHNDQERTIAALRGIGGKRITYRRINQAA
jgi:transposase-like protein